MKLIKFLNHLAAIICHLALISFGAVVQVIAVIVLQALSLLFGGQMRGAIEAQNIFTILYLKWVQDFLKNNFGRHVVSNRLFQKIE